MSTNLVYCRLFPAKRSVQSVSVSVCVSVSVSVRVRVRVLVRRGVCGLVPSNLWTNGLVS